MKNDTIIIGTRASKLALWQAEYVKRRLEEKYPELSVALKKMTTKGDQILDAPLAKIGGKGLFTKELEDAMLEGEVDIAVHSLKDMPTEVPSGLIISAITKRFDVGDAIVSSKYEALADLPKGAKVGTSSLRRKAQLLHERSDLDIHDLRGNVGTRLDKLESENFDAVILAVAGLKRLGFGDRITEVIDQKIMLPAVGQGALAIETREDDKAIRARIDFLNDPSTVTAAKAERAFLSRVQGGCQVPVGVYATEVKAGLHVEAVIASLDGMRLYRAGIDGAREEAEHLGTKLAEKLLDDGGRAILKEIGLDV